MNISKLCIASSSNGSSQLTGDEPSAISQRRLQGLELLERVGFEFDEMKPLGKPADQLGVPCHFTEGPGGIVEAKFVAP